MIFGGHMSGLRAMKRAQLQRIWTNSARTYSADVSIEYYA